MPGSVFYRGGPGAMVSEGEGEKISLQGDVVGSFAQGLGRIGGRHAGSERWSRARLAEMLDRLYEAAIASQELTL